MLNPPKLTKDRPLTLGLIKGLVNHWYKTDIDTEIYKADQASYWRDNAMALYQFDDLRNSLQARKLKSSILTEMREDRFFGSVKTTAKVLPDKDTSNVRLPKYQIIAASRP